MKRCSSKSCRACHYPNYYVTNIEKKQIYHYYEDWATQEFVISTKTAFTIEYLAETKALIQRARVSFKGNESSYNFLHGYKDADYCPSRKRKVHDDVDLLDDDNEDDQDIHFCYDDGLLPCSNTQEEESELSYDLDQDESLFKLIQTHVDRNSVSRKLIEIAHFRYSLLKFYERH